MSLNLWNLSCDPDLIFVCMFINEIILSELKFLSNLSDY